MLFDDTYRTIETNAEGIFRDRGSKFIGYAFPVKTEEEVKEKLAILGKKHFGARHHCYAFRLGADKQFFRVNDDGEPSGTAGKPIYGQLLSNDLTDILILVVRYFGGTLLGVPGLIAAYRTAAADALANAKIIEKHVMEAYEIIFPYDCMNDVMKIMKDNQLEQWDQDFQLVCRMKFAVRLSKADEIVNELKKKNGVEMRFIGRS